jgi:hypothetical protein
MTALVRKQRFLPLLLTVFIALAGSPARAQAPVAPWHTASWDAPLLPSAVTILNIGGPLQGEISAADRAARCRMFRMPTGYGCDTAVLEADDDPPPDPADPGWLGGSAPDSRRWNLLLGADNPYFDMAVPGAAGGVGYYKLHTQCQLYDAGTSGFCLALQAAAPAGIDGDGVADGPTTVAPAIGYYQELTGGAAIQGFVGKSLHARSGWSDNLGRSIRYGLAVQSPAWSAGESQDSGIRMFVEALGRTSYVSDGTANGPDSTWALLPGVHWRLGENCWMTGGVLLPLSSPRPETNHWQWTWFWRF